LTCFGELLQFQFSEEHAPSGDVTDPLLPFIISYFDSFCQNAVWSVGMGM